MQSFEEMKSYIGKRCTVYVSYIEGEEEARETGTLLDVSEEGDVKILSDKDNKIHYMWPALEIKEPENESGEI